MKRWVILGIAGLGLGNTGCFLNAYSSDPNRRMHELLVQSENLRQVENETERFWMTDTPSHLTYERIDGGIQ